jgi:hypothetical protein
MESSSTQSSCHGDPCGQCLSFLASQRVMAGGGVGWGGVVAEQVDLAVLNDLKPVIPATWEAEIGRILV